MPTVKLQNGKVLLKDGKVSCTCCESPEPGCCMYPAAGLGDTFFAADLPATLYGKWADRADGTFTKSGSTFTNGTVTIRRNTGGTAWEFHDSTDDATLTIGNCLIRGDGGLTPEDDRVEDQFPDKFYVSIDGHGTVECNRVSISHWVGHVTLNNSAVYGDASPVDPNCPSWPEFSVVVAYPCGLEGGVELGCGYQKGWVIQVGNVNSAGGGPQGIKTPVGIYASPCNESMWQHRGWNGEYMYVWHNQGDDEFETGWYLGGPSSDGFMSSNWNFHYSCVSGGYMEDGAWFLGSVEDAWGVFKVLSVS
jgi:hypothetical protein